MPRELWAEMADDRPVPPEVMAMVVVEWGWSCSKRNSKVHLHLVPRLHEGEMLVRRHGRSGLGIKEFSNRGIKKFSDRGIKEFSDRGIKKFSDRG